MKAYLESEIGSAELQRIVVGATIPNIGVAQLKTLMIPSAPLKEQQEVAAKCRDSIAEVKKLQKEIESVQERMKHLFDETV